MEKAPQGNPKVALLKSEGEVFRLAEDVLKVSAGSEHAWDCEERLCDPKATWSQIQAQLEGFDVAVLSPSLRGKAAKGIPSRSVESHFLLYADFLVRKGSLWWSHALQSQIFGELLMQVLRERDFRGPVIFLGQNVLVSPILQILCRYSYTDICFLTLDDGEVPSEVPVSLKQVQVSRVDSAAFIQSQKEYALCIICESNFSKDVLEDMSYFHFLSPRSTVFDMSGGSNFQKEEVKALGVHFVSAPEVNAVEIDIFTKQIQDSISS